MTWWVKVLAVWCVCAVIVAGLWVWAFHDPDER